MIRRVWQGPDLRRALREVEFHAQPKPPEDEAWPAWGEPHLIYKVEDLEDGGYEVRGVTLEEFA
jgi:hypothetical protein